MKTSLRLSAFLLLVTASALAQTYTYKNLYSFNLQKHRFGAPSNALLIINGVGYGSDYAGHGGIYIAKSSGVRELVSCCETFATLIADSSGNLYGVSGLANGAIYELSPPTWDHVILYRFTGGGDGQIPSDVQSPLLPDGDGNFWSTAFAGGANSCNYGDGETGCGVVYELVNNGGAWSEQVIYSFAGSPDGAGPGAGLTYDPFSGVYYGTTEIGGDPACEGGLGCGIVFELSPNGDGTWTETVLHSFTQPDGLGPEASVVLDSEGNLYGTARAGGDPSCNCGTVYEISAGGQFTVLHTFEAPTDGGAPLAALTFDQYGTLWGTAQAGGVDGVGTLFTLTQANGSWQFSVFHSFTGTQRGNRDGAAPASALTLDSNGNLWGTTPGGGSSEYGTIYEVQVAP